ncbi:hypothetical protein AL573_04460 [Rickettsia amblyommatis]|nr:hypothetical protein AL573_04460 [Rickettsia amblyommatis]
MPEYKPKQQINKLAKVVKLFKINKFVKISVLLINRYVIKQINNEIIIKKMLSIIFKIGFTVGYTIVIVIARKLRSN